MANYYGVFDEAGKPISFFCSSVHKEVPPEASQITEGDWQNYLTGNFYRDPTGVCRVIPQPPQEVLARRLVEARQKQLNSDLLAYIASHYDTGTQASFQALYVLEATPQEIKNAVLEVWWWIRSVMAYYYTTKGMIGNLTTVEALQACSWNFLQFEETLPQVTLGDIYAMM